MRGKFLTLVAAALLLSGCAMMMGAKPPQPPRVEGPLATLSETGLQDSRTEVDMFVATGIDGHDVQTSMDRTRQFNAGMGMSIVPKYVEHAIPAGRPVAVTIMGHSYHGAPILSILNSEYEVTGTVTFTPAVNRIYEVKGTLGDKYSAVWIEESATGRVMGQKIEKRD
ncbi:MAG TPA: hypothetical protein VMF58_18515 [Rhizomicrobium sp.]|nr:hypothetical protein [Rhizomicrobium sp.]